MAVLPATGATPAAWSRVDRQASSVAPHVAVVAAKMTASGQLQIVHQSGPTDARPLASMVKLYVLIAVAQAVQSGTLRWDQRLTLQSTDKAAGSGALIGAASGSTVTVQQAATLMIQISDNTATDLLIRAVGQSALAKAVASTGSSNAAKLVPFTTIRQDIWLEWSTSAAAVQARARWAGASTQTRMSLMAPATAPGSPVPDATGAGTTARWQDGLGYFASALDIAKAQVVLARLVRQKGLEPLQSILDVTRTGITTPTSWRQVSFKGGTVMGVQTGSWYARTTSGDEVLVVMASSPGGVNTASFNALASKAAAALAG